MAILTRSFNTQCIEGIVGVLADSTRCQPMAAPAAADSNVLNKLQRITAENGMRNTENPPSVDDALKIRPTTAPKRIPFLTPEVAG